MLPHVALYSGSNLVRVGPKPNQTFLAGIQCARAGFSKCQPCLLKRDSEKAKKKTTDTPQSRRPNRSFCVTFRRKPVPKRHSRWKNLTGANMRRSSRYTTIISFFPREILETAFNTVPRVQINPITGHCNGNERRAGRGGRCADSAARRVSISLHFRPFGGSHRSSRNDSACQSVSPPFFFLPSNSQPTFVPDNFDSCF